MSTVQAKVWDICHTMVKFVSTSHLEVIIFRHDKSGMKCRSHLIKFTIASYLEKMLVKHDKICMECPLHLGMIYKYISPC